MLSSFLIVAAQSSPYLHRSWTTNQGLPQNTVNAIVQTRDGYLWLGTYGGLVNFDGAKFRIFDTANSPGLKSNRILALLEDRKGRLWIGTQYGGLSLYEAGAFVTFTAKDGLPSDSVLSLVEDRQGDLWITTSAGLSVYRESRIQTPQVSAELARQNPQALCADAGGLWIGSDIGLTRMTGSGETTLRKHEGIDLGLPLRAFRYCRADRDGSVWFSIRDQKTGSLLRYRDGAMKTVFQHRIGAEYVIQNFIATPDGRLLMLSDRGIAETSQGEVRHQAIEGFARMGTPFLAIEDHEGSLWIGAGGSGLHQFRIAQIRAHAAEITPIDKSFVSIAGGADGALYLGSDLGGLYAYRKGRFETLDPSMAIWAIYESPDGSLWYGNYGQLLRRTSAGRVVNYTKDLKDLQAFPVTTMYEDAEGAMWIGGGIDGGTEGRSGGLYRWKGDQFTVYRTPEGLPHNDVRMIKPARRHGLWIGTVGGLSHFADGRFTNYTTQQGLSHDYVRDIFEQDDGAVWIGTYGGGLNRLKDGRIVPVTTRAGLCDNIVSRILPDDAGNFWMSCNRGIYRVRRQELNDYADGKISSIHCVRYGEADGMKSSECNGGAYPAGWRAADGTLWFPTQQGVVAVDPGRGASPAPPVHIDQVVLDRGDVDFRKGVQLLPGQGNLEIHYAGLSFRNPEQVRFRYKLQGWDRDWIEVGPRRSAYFAYLEPGDYTFLVTAAGGDSEWNERFASLRIRVVPPLWRRWWFLSGCGLALIALAALAYRRRIAQLQRAREAQEVFSRQLIASQEGERQRIAAELHDSLGQRLLFINNQSLLGRQSDPSAGKHFEEISAQSQQAIDEVREIVRNLRPYHLDRLGLTRALQAMIRSVGSASGIHFEQDLDPIDDAIPAPSQIVLYRIVQEALNNIVKHSQASEAGVEIRREARAIVLKIWDNGRGLDPALLEASPERGFGLAGMAERVRILQGKQSIRSAPGHGTTILITIEIETRQE